MQTITTLNNKIAYENAENITAFQMVQLKQQLAYIVRNNPFYATALKNANITIADINSYKDLEKLPMLDKAVVQENIEAFTCINIHDTAEIDTTSGTLGQPLSIALSPNDLIRLSYNESLSFESMQLSPNDIVQLTLTLDRQFMAGMAYYTGLKEIGATIVRIGPGVPQMQWDAIQKYQTTVLVAVPSFLKKLIDYANANQIDFLNSSVKKVLAIGESLYHADGSPTILKQTLSELWPIEYFNTYASTEMQTGFTECTYHQGMHLNPDLIIAEIVDENGRQLPEKVIGELCITTLGVEGVPLVRYNTGDMTSISFEPCACGKNTPRIFGIEGRAKQLLKIKGTSVYPNAIFEALDESNQVKSYFIKAHLNDLGQDDVTIFISLYTQDDVDKKLANIKAYLKAKLKINLSIMLLSDAEILQMQFPVHSRKQIKFLDLR